MATKAILNTKMNEVKNNIPSITSLATNFAFASVQNKNPSVTRIKTNYDTKVSKIEKKTY